MLAIGCNDKSSLDASLKLPGDKAGAEDLFQLWICNEKGNRFENAKTHSENQHTKSITDVAWAPYVGRSFHMIVSPSKDLKLILWRFCISFSKDGEIEDLNLKHIAMVAFNYVVCA